MSIYVHILHAYIYMYVHSAKKGVTNIQYPTLAYVYVYIYIAQPSSSDACIKTSALASVQTQVRSFIINS